MSNREGKPQKRSTRRNQRCPNCLKGKLQPCSCGCINRGNHVLTCNVCKYVNY